MLEYLEFVEYLDISNLNGAGIAGKSVTLSGRHLGPYSVQVADGGVCSSSGRRAFGKKGLCSPLLAAQTRHFSLSLSDRKFLLRCFFPVTVCFSPWPDILYIFDYG